MAGTNVLHEFWSSRVTVIDLRAGVRQHPGWYDPVDVNGGIQLVLKHQWKMWDPLAPLPDPDLTQRVEVEESDEDVIYLHSAAF